MAHDLSSICHGTGTNADLMSVGGTAIGLTRDGVTMSPTLETNFVLDNADGMAAAIAGYHTRRGFRISGTRLEITPEGLAQDWARAAPAAGVVKLGGTFAATEVAILIYGGPSTGSTLRTISLAKAVAVDPGDFVLHETSEHESGFAYEIIFDVGGTSEQEFGTLTDT